MSRETALDWFSLARDMRDDVALGKMDPEAEFLDVIGTKVLRVFLLFYPPPPTRAKVG
jgi:hypothetical protein